MIELGGIIILGILAQWFAWKLKIPAILPLLLIGLLVGPISAEFLSSNGTKWIEPIWNGEEGLFAGKNLYYFVSLSISIILFEGGLTLKIKEIKNVGPLVITKLITLGSLVTFFGAAVGAHFIFSLSWEMSFLFSSLIIVTGPTVITPILRNIPLRKDISAILKWEGILIDPIGALVAVLVFEFISVGAGQEYTKTALVEFGKIVLFGSTFGFTFAHALNFTINKKWIPHYLLNVVSLASVLGVFILSDTFAHESGLLAVVIMGMVLGNSQSSYLKDLLYFKESLSVLLISILFILLSANINFKDLNKLLIHEINKKDEIFDCFLGNKFSVKNYKISKIIKKHFFDFLLNPKLIFNKNKRNLKFHFDLFHGKGNLDMAISLLDKNYQNDFKYYMENNTEFYPHNMFICKTEKIKNYYEIIFPWLKKCEKIFGFDNLDSYGTKRIYGFLAERFLSFWFSKSFTIKELPIIGKDLTDYKNL